MSEETKEYYKALLKESKPLLEEAFALGGMRYPTPEDEARRVRLTDTVNMCTNFARELREAAKEGIEPF
jgi:7-keto-8-aminopelargonate synthetase-like enzyme